MPVLTFENPLLEGNNMPKKDIDKNAIILKSDNTIAANRWRSKLTVSFKPIIIGRKSRPLETTDFKYGCTEAEIGITLVGSGKYAYYTPSGGELNVTQQNSIELAQTEASSFKPTLKMEAGSVKGELGVGEISDNTSVKSVQGNSFQIKEFMLNAVECGNQVIWYIKKPKGENPLHAFLLGNQVLDIDVEMGSIPFHGEFHARPSALRYFDGDQTPVKQNLLMRFLLKKKFKKMVSNPDGFTLKFEIK